MFSVLILNQKTYDSFQKFHPLFLEKLNKKEIGVCRWLESGNTLDYALSGLNELTDDKKAWRAIIVHLEDDDGSEMQKYKRSTENPFDFDINHSAETAYGESEVPLIRLTHLLGGFPEPKIQYVPVRHYYDPKRSDVLDSEAPKEDEDLFQINYVPKVDEGQQDIYEKICRKYEYNGKRPSEIILISVRKQKLIKQDKIKAAWKRPTEIQSSKFWETNNYANGCRFLVYDMSENGKAEHDADLFKLWNAIMLVASNHINTNELQAYRLYRIGIQISNRELLKNLQILRLKMVGAKQYIDNYIQRQINRELEERVQLPAYEVDIPVRIDLPQRSSFNVDNKEFTLISHSISNDLHKWNGLKTRSEVEIKNRIHQSIRSLDDSGERMHELMSVRDSSVYKLNKFQKREMQENLNELFETIIRSQSDLPDPNEVIDQRLEKNENRITELIKKQLLKSQVEVITLITLGVIALAGIPAGFYFFNIHAGQVGQILLVLGILFVLPFLCILIMVIQKRFLMKDAIHDYNISLNNAIDKIVKNKEKYAKFFSDITSHSRGCSYLQILQHKKFYITNLDEIIQIHRNNIDQTILLTKLWARSFYLDFDDSIDYDYDEIFDVEQAPKVNYAYTFETGEQYVVPINHSGSVIYSPFDYITRLDLIREELYDAD